MLARFGVVVVVLSVAVGCGTTRAGGVDGGTDIGVRQGDGGKADGGNDGPSVDCGALSARWEDLVASVSQSCQQDGDCALAGTRASRDQYPAHGSGLDMDGVPVNAEAYRESPAAALEDEWVQTYCWQMYDGNCPNAVTCADGQCAIIYIRACEPFNCVWRCPRNQYCYTDRLSLGCASDCAPESVCDQYCCGPGWMCRKDTYSSYCVPIPDGGLDDSGLADAAPDAPPDGPPGDRPVDAWAD